MRRDFFKQLLPSVWVVLLLGLLLPGGFDGHVCHAQQYTITDLGTLPKHSYSRAYGINNFGEVVGFSAPALDYASDRAFLWRDGVITDLGTLPGDTSSFASAISDTGQVVGSTCHFPAFPPCDLFRVRAFLWSEGMMTDLGNLGRGPTFAVGINSAGQVVGRSRNSGGSDRAFIWENGVMTDLGDFGGPYSAAKAINESGQVVGMATTASVTPHAFLWSDGVMEDLYRPGTGAGVARAINDQGQVIINNCDYGEDLCNIGGLPNPIYLWSEGVLTDLGTFLGDRTYAKGINASGQVVGVGWARGGRAFLWSEGVFSDLNDLIPGDSGWVLEWANAINNAGQIVGHGTLNGRSPRAFLLNPTK